MSKGGFTGKGVFGTLSYLVVVYENGQEKQCNFKHEEDVDRFLAYIEEEYPGYSGAQSGGREKAGREGKMAGRKVKDHKSIYFYSFKC